MLGWRKLILGSLKISFALAILAGAILLAAVYLNPIMVHAIQDVEFGSTQSPEARIAQWEPILKEQEKIHSVEFMADLTNSLGYTYFSEAVKTGKDQDRLLMARWCFEHTLAYAKSAPATTKAKDQIEYAENELERLSKDIATRWPGRTPSPAKQVAKSRIETNQNNPTVHEGAH